jgi:hypothetical protein
VKNTLVKITPEGLDPERMVVTTDSSAHEFVKDYAKDNGYPIEEHACANRFQCILQDLERIRITIETHCPIVMKQPALCEGQHSAKVKVYSMIELSQCFTNIEVACNEEMDDPEFAWMQPELPTYEEYTKGWSLALKMKMYWDEDLANRKLWTYKDVAHALDNADWLPDFEEKFKKYLQEREYIR